MKNTQTIKLLILAFFLLAFFDSGFACSGYKLTIGDHTIFGSNEDAWRTTPHIWVETASENGNTVRHILARDMTDKMVTRHRQE
jgi:hypothetical protein